MFLIFHFFSSVFSSTLSSFIYYFFAHVPSFSRPTSSFLFLLFLSPSTPSLLSYIQSLLHSLLFTPSSCPSSSFLFLYCLSPSTSFFPFFRTLVIYNHSYFIFYSHSQLPRGVDFGCSSPPQRYSFVSSTPWLLFYPFHFVFLLWYHCTVLGCASGCVILGVYNFSLWKATFFLYFL